MAARRRVFLDSNIPMYVAGADHPNRDAARRILAEARSGGMEACTSTEVLQEILYRYSSLRRLDLAREVYTLFTALCPVIHDVTLADTDLARDLLLTVPGISARDAVHAAVMRNHDITWIATFDNDFSRVPSLQRFEAPATNP